MLHFFRRYQKIIFLFTTCLVVISFVFFGTYRAIGPSLGKKESDQVLYTTLQGRKITTGYLEKMERFLELEPAFSYDVAKVIQSNPLNDGVLARDFLIHGFGNLLLSENSREILEKKAIHEKTYIPYQHPVLKSLSAQKSWEMLVPDLAEQFVHLRQAKDVLSREAIEARVALYLSHQRCNGDFLKQILRYQEYQEGVAPDPILAHKDLSLFGYHTLRDWFGDQFIEKAAKIVIHGSQLAKVRGLKVAQDEVYVDIHGRVQECFTALQQRGQSLSVQNSAELLRFMAHRLHMEESDVMQIWEDVLYFRRLLDERSSSVRIDGLALEKFHLFAHESVGMKVVEMPKELRFTTVDELKAFELYIEAVGEKRDDLLSLPTRYQSLESIMIGAPELIGRRFWLAVAHVDKKELSSKVPLTELWAWEEKNYDHLRNIFGLPSYAQFESSDDALREKVDQYAYVRIIDEHPEWIEEVLETKPYENQEIFLAYEQKKNVLTGIVDYVALRDRLEREDFLINYSQDGQNYYKISVKEKGKIGEILSYEEAKKIGALAALMERKESNRLVQKVIAGVHSVLEKNGIALPKEGIEKFCVERRFYNYLQKVKMDPHYAEGFDTKYVPQTHYKTIKRGEEGFDRVIRCKKGEALFGWDKEHGLYLYEVDGVMTESELPLNKLYILQQLASSDVRKELIKEILADL